ncbi:MAG: hypothetical protein ABEN55_14720 [Bradymonadaceae bacterium]
MHQLPKEADQTPVEDEYKKPDWGDAILDRPTPVNSSERKRHRLGALIGAAGGGAAGLAAGGLAAGPAGAAYGAGAGIGFGADIGTAVGDKKNLDQRYQEGRPTYYADENRSKMRAIDQMEHQRD